MRGAGASPGSSGGKQEPTHLGKGALHTCAHSDGTRKTGRSPHLHVFGRKSQDPEKPTQTRENAQTAHTQGLRWEAMFCSTWSQKAIPGNQVICGPSVPTQMVALLGRRPPGFAKRRAQVSKLLFCFPTWLPPQAGGLVDTHASFSNHSSSAHFPQQLSPRDDQPQRRPAHRAARERPALLRRACAVPPTSAGGQPGSPRPSSSPQVHGLPTGWPPAPRGRRWPTRDLPCRCRFPKTNVFRFWADWPAWRGRRDLRTRQITSNG